MKALFVCFLICASCAYRQGAPERSIPGGYKEVRVPMFKNLTSEVGIETSFTNAVIDKIAESRVARLSPQAEVDIVGTIESVDFFRSGQRIIGKIGEDKWGLATDYRVVIVIDLAVKKRDQDQVLWSSKFTGQRTYSGAQITAPIVNSANPIYNGSARRRNIAELALDIVAEAADRMTENF